MLNSHGIQRALDNAELPASVWAEKPWSGVSSKYNFAPTGEVVTALAAGGIRPYLAKSSRTRIESKWGLTKHMLRFRKDGVEPLPGGVYPEIVIVNSHDTGSSFTAQLGMFRLICKNGMVASYGNVAQFRARHIGLELDNVLRAVSGLVEEFPRLAETIERMQRIELNERQRESMAFVASRLRWDEGKVPFESSMLLVTRRTEDEAPTLWNVLNTIQENLIQGQRVRTFGPSFRGYRTRTQSTRPVGSIDRDMELNNKLWTLASEYATV